MVLVFGATGFSGRMVVEQLVARNIPVRTAARTAEKLDALAGRLSGVEPFVADVGQPESVVEAATGCELLITTVGPYTRHGAVAADAALAAGVPYVDITGEPPWLRRMFDEYDARAREAGIAMLPAFGYDYVPGNLAGALALERAGERAVQIDVAYFLAGRQRRDTESFSRGTLDSLKASSGEPGFSFRDGRIQPVEGRRSVQQHVVDGEEVSAIGIGASEHFTLPRFAPWLREVNVALGWFQPGQKAQTPAAASDADQPEGPGERKRAESRARVVAIARDADGAELVKLDVDGPNPYDLSGLLTAWAAERMLAGAVSASGTLGPVEAFGLQQLRDGCAEIGLTVSGSRPADRHRSSRR